MILVGEENNVFLYYFLYIYIIIHFPVITRNVLSINFSVFILLSVHFSILILP